MDLVDYIRVERGNGARLCSALGVSQTYLSQMASGYRPTPPQLCARLEHESGGAVRRWDSRPHDWHLIWPELVGADGAPDVSVERTAA
jgi:DNA-binding transcriptional regulator YdaS (Cro superfamily)